MGGFWRPYKVLSPCSFYDCHHVSFIYSIPFYEEVNNNFQRRYKQGLFMVIGLLPQHHPVFMPAYQLLHTQQHVVYDRHYNVLSGGLCLGQHTYL